jgi:hypothetical protein
MTEKHMYTSVRLLLLRELADSTIHEALHLEGITDDEEVSLLASQASWDFAKGICPDGFNFGHYFESRMDKFHADLREDVERGDGPPEWKKIQLHMFDNHLSYYDPDGPVEIKTLRQAMEFHVGEEHPWPSLSDSGVASWGGDTEAQGPPVSTTTEAAPVMAPAPAAAPTQEAPLSTPAATGPAVAAPPSPSPAAPTDSSPGATTDFQAHDESVPDFGYDDYNPLDDIATQHDDNPFDETDAYAATQHVTQTMTPAAMPSMTSAPGSQQAPAAAPVADPVPTLPQQQTDMAEFHRIQQITEQVLRRLFNHVQTKCEFNTLGGYNNPGAVLEPIAIHDIPGANELFVSMDTLNIAGQIERDVKVEGYLKGSITKTGGLPQYRFAMKFGDQLLRRSFIAQNPAGNGKWAQAAQTGTRIMALRKPVAENAPPTCHIQLAPGMPLGQEVFKLWGDK